MSSISTQAELQQYAKAMQEATLEIKRKLETGEFSQLPDYQKSQILTEFLKQLNGHADVMKEKSQVLLKACPSTFVREERVDMTEPAEAQHANNIFAGIHPLLGQ